MRLARLEMRKRCSLAVAVCLFSCGGGSGSGGAPVIASLQIKTAPSSLSSINQQLTLTAVALDASGAAITSPALAWDSSAPAVASVGATSGAVTAQSNGSAVISVHSGDKAAQITVTVQQLTAAVSVTPATDTLLPGQTVTLVAQAKDALGTPLSPTPAAAWSTSNAAVVTIDAASGLATAQLVAASTQATLTATIAGQTGSAQLTVDPNAPRVTSVTVATHQAGAATTLASLHATLQLDGTALDSGGHVVAVSLTWTSNSANVATVDQTGLVTAQGNGTARIVATAPGNVQGGLGRDHPPGRGLGAADASDGRRRGLEVDPVLGGRQGCRRLAPLQHRLCL